MAMRQDLLRMSEKLEKQIRMLQAARENILKVISELGEESPKRDSQAQKEVSPAATSQRKPSSPDTWSRIQALMTKRNEPLGTAEITKALGLPRITVDYHIGHHRKDLAKSGAGSATKCQAA